MSAVAVLIVLISSFIHATWNFLAKKSGDKLTFFWLVMILQTLIYLPFAVFFLYKTSISLYGWYAIFASGIVHAFYWYFLSKAYTYEDLSLVYPIARSAPALVPILAFLFLNERLKLLGVVGIIIVLIGVYATSLNSFNLRKFFRPFYDRENKGISFAFLTLFTVSMYSLIDKVGAKYVNPILYVYFFVIVSFIILSPIILLTEKRSMIKSELKNNKTGIILVSIMIILSYALIIFVMRIFPVSYIVSVRQAGIVFSVLLGTFLLKEKYGKVRLTASILIFIGIFFIAIFGKM
ncbi:MAG: DMT family transporter [Caldisericota bacterium]|nr:DMT family transporter [Caldisericota bacterium]